MGVLITPTAQTTNTNVIWHNCGITTAGYTFPVPFPTPSTCGTYLPTTAYIGQAPTAYQCYQFPNIGTTCGAAFIGNTGITVQITTVGGNTTGITAYNNTYGITANNYTATGLFNSVNPLRRFKDMLIARRSPIIITGRRPIREIDNDVREMRARATLRKIIGEEEYRKYLSKGFLSIRGKSGRVYQIFPGHGFTRVFDNGKELEQLCVVMKGGFPPTDSLLTRYVMLLNDEDNFAKLANRHQMRGKLQSLLEKAKHLPSLTDLYRQIVKPQNRMRASMSVLR